MNADHIMSWGFFDSELLIIWRMSFLEKWQLANKFSVSKFDYDDKTLLSAKKSEDFTFSFNRQCTIYLLKSLLFLTNSS